MWFAKSTGSNPISVLATVGIFSIFTADTLAFYIIILGRDRTSWWTPGARLPRDAVRYSNEGICYPAPAYNNEEDATVEAFVLYNPPYQIPIRALGFWKSKRCDVDGPSQPDWIFQVPEKTVIGIHAIPAIKFGIHLEARSFRPIKLEEERKDADGYLYKELPEPPDGALFVWDIVRDSVSGIISKVGEAWRIGSGLLTPWWLPEMAPDNIYRYLRNGVEMQLDPQMAQNYLSGLTKRLEEAVDPSRKLHLIAEATRMHRALKNIWENPIPRWRGGQPVHLVNTEDVEAAYRERVKQGFSLPVPHNSPTEPGEVVLLEPEVEIAAGINTGLGNSPDIIEIQDPNIQEEIQIGNLTPNNDNRDSLSYETQQWSLGGQAIDISDGDSIIEFIEGLERQRKIDQQGERQDASPLIHENLQQEPGYLPSDGNDDKLDERPEGAMILENEGPAPQFSGEMGSGLEGLDPDFFEGSPNRQVDIEEMQQWVEELPDIFGIGDQGEQEGINDDAAPSETNPISRKGERALRTPMLDVIKNFENLAFQEQVGTDANDGDDPPPNIQIEEGAPQLNVQIEEVNSPIYFSNLDQLTSGLFTDNPLSGLRENEELLNNWDPEFFNNLVNSQQHLDSIRDINQGLTAVSQVQSLVNAVPQGQNDRSNPQWRQPGRGLDKYLRKPTPHSNRRQQALIRRPGEEDLIEAAREEYDRFQRQIEHTTSQNAATQTEDLLQEGQAEMIMDSRDEYRRLENAMSDDDEAALLFARYNQLIAKKLKKESDTAWKKTE
ncbi:hypothetical protein ABW20_dc0108191 [Dactylellina cionopaga]|nr:hypothetical protein ABW20_dc0108191 [Dactylellina cionopaga]